MKLMSQKDRKQAFNLTERLMNDSIIGFGLQKEESPVEKKMPTTQRVIASILRRPYARSTLEAKNQTLTRPILHSQIEYHNAIIEKKKAMVN
jgi:hypothetical protein